MTRPTPERLKEIKDGWAKANGPDGGTVMAQEFASEHFEELLTCIDQLEAENTKLKIEEIDRISAENRRPDRRYDLHDCMLERDQLREKLEMAKEALETVMELDASANPGPSHVSIWSIAYEALTKIRGVP